MHNLSGKAKSTTFFKKLDDRTSHNHPQYDLETGSQAGWAK